MFYEVNIPEAKPGEKLISALVVLNPSESRRLLAKATVALPEVQNAWKNGMIIIGRGITNAYVSEELFKISVEPKGAQTAGIISNGFMNATAAAPPCSWHVVRNGKVMEGADSNVEIEKFGPEDVFIKGANAIDHQGNAGVYAASPKGGTIGMCWPIVTARGSHLIQPVGLEKLVPSVLDASMHSGVFHFKYSMGLPGRVFPLTSSKVVTEIQAFAILAGVRAYHLSSGGVGGSEGAIVLGLEGNEERVTKAFELAKSVKGEPAVAQPDVCKLSSPADYKYDAMAQHAGVR